jgi:endonuclease/exonuclease/phosphatase family metal-dependent hydrolase
MRMLIGFLFFISTLSFASVELKVMSFNTMCKLCDLKQNYGPFEERLNHIVETIERSNPDLIAMQEIQNSQHIKLISEKLHQNYLVIYKKFWLWPGTDSILLIKKNRFSILDHEGLWLGPKSPKFNLGWVKRTPRKLEKVRLLDQKTNKEFIFVGIHFDNNSINKFNSAKFVNNLLANDDLPIILAGDSNLTPDTDGFKMLQGNFVDTFLEVNQIDYLSNSPMDANEACSDGDGVQFPSCRIDHVFFSPNSGFKVKKWSIDLYKYFENKMHVSDHRAVMTTLEIE